VAPSLRERLAFLVEHPDIERAHSKRRGCTVRRTSHTRVAFRDKTVVVDATDAQPADMRPRFHVAIP
jgi:hypothetical protein